MLTPGTHLQNRYQIVRQLGAGGMGAVYLAQDLRLQKIVALKENSGGDPRQFQQEAVLLANLNHPNLPRVIDHFVESNAQYLVMDFIAGEDLQARIDRAGALPEAQVLAWFDQILDAVTYLHDRGIIHRDIKPANIKITPQGQAVLVDFGIAKVYRPGVLTSSNARFGSPGFASPEHYRGGTDQRSDIYSLGATLYALLTGHAPPDALARVGGSAMLVPPRQLKPALSYPVEQVILRALAISPGQRWQTVDELRAVFKSSIVQPPTVSQQPTPAVPSIPPVNPLLMPTMPTMPPERLVTKPSRTVVPFVPVMAGIIIAGAILILIAFSPAIIATLARRPAVIPTMFPAETPIATKFAIALPPTFVPSAASLTPSLVIATRTLNISTPRATLCNGTIITYTVQWGDWLRKIAENHGVSIEALIAANPGINPNITYPGQVLQVPAPCGAMPTPMDVTPVSPCSPSTYTAQQGDWFYQVARRFGVSVAQLQAANPGINPNFLYPGLVLNIPCSSPDTTSSGSATSTSGASGTTTYTVQPGDTLYAIAVRFHTTTYALQIVNHLPNANATYPGMVLIIPPSDATLPMPSVTPMP